MACFFLDLTPCCCSQSSHRNPCFFCSSNKCFLPCAITLCILVYQTQSVSSSSRLFSTRNRLTTKKKSVKNIYISIRNKRKKCDFRFFCVISGLLLNNKKNKTKKQKTKNKKQKQNKTKQNKTTTTKKKH